MNGARDFAAYGLDDARMRVAEAVNGYAAEKIEIFFAAGIVNIRATAVGEDDGLAFVSWQEKLVGVLYTRIVACDVAAGCFAAATRAKRGDFLRMDIMPPKELRGRSRAARAIRACQE